MMNYPGIFGLLVLCCLLFACEDPGQIVLEDDEKDPDTEINVGFDTLSITNNFLFNVPIVDDTVFIDKQYNIDIRIEIEGYSIDSVTITKNGYTFLECDTTIISSKYFSFYENIGRVEFLIRSVNLDDKDTVYFKSKSILFKTVERLSSRYVYNSVEDGRLKLTWQEFDKKNTQKYLVERWIMDDNFMQNYGVKKYYQSFEVDNAIFIDHYYVGEDAEYKISIINNESNKQDIWYYKKSKELPIFNVTQNTTGGYNLHFSKCKYFNNFGQYYLTDGYNTNPAFVLSTNQVSDTTILIADAKFANEARFWLRYLPKQLPDDFSEDDWYIYGKFIYAQYGIPSILYDNIAVLNNNSFAYTFNGKIFKYDTENNHNVDSIVKQGVNYGYIKSTADGKFIYSIDSNQDNPTIQIWSTNFSTNPIYDFRINYTYPPISNNLRTIMKIPSNYSSSKLAIYDLTNGNIIYTTNYEGSSKLPVISPNGDYFFIYDSNSLKLCNYSNNSFEVIWSENNWPKFYRFYNFSRLDNGLCYVWDDDKVFSIRKTSDFSIVNSFPLALEAIVDIDYYSNKIMGYISDKIVIYDLNNGNLIREIPANLMELFFYDNRTILMGNTIYNNNGIKFDLNQ